MKWNFAARWSKTRRGLALSRRDLSCRRGSLPASGLQPTPLAFTTTFIISNTKLFSHECLFNFCVLGRAALRVIGQSIDTDDFIQVNLNSITDYYGLWSDNFKSGDIIVRTRADKRNGYLFEHISPTDPQPSEYARQLIKRKRNGSIVFDVTNFPEQYFVLENNGDLSVYDAQGFVGGIEN